MWRYDQKRFRYRAVDKRVGLSVIVHSQEVGHYYPALTKPTKSDFFENIISTLLMCCELNDKLPSFCTVNKLNKISF